MFQKDMKISLLLDFYGDVLSGRRLEIMKMYYDEDLSLSEIAEITGISRQGVRDSVKKSESELTKLEQTLNLAGRFDKVRSELDLIAEEIENISATCTDDARCKLETVSGKIRELDI